MTTTTDSAVAGPGLGIEADWTPPGPGVWVVDRSHNLGSPTRFFSRIAGTNTQIAYREALREFGAVLDTIDIQVVNGALYRRLVPLIGARFDRGTPPPKPAMWLVTRTQEPPLPRPDRRVGDQRTRRVDREESRVAADRPRRLERCRSRGSHRTTRRTPGPQLDPASPPACL